ncbi:MAG TPA: hypothetical protein VK399_06190 [Longimicrobiaceae bacterium]|nr:hypothetical protein [Longimicrobiaceae bacterium]
MALGQTIVRELELDARGKVLERWLAHHLAELIAEADGAAGRQKEKAERKAVDLILRLWMHRRALPSPVDPLGGYREAIAVLSALVPDANPWKRYRHHHTYEGLLQEIFETVSWITIDGLLLTHVGHVRAISEAESAALEEEEIYLQAEIEKWMKFIPPQPDFNVVIVDADSEDSAEDQDDFSEDESDDLTPEQQMARLESNAHSAIAAHLERIQADLSTLLTRWKTVAPNQVELGEDTAEDGEDDD